MTLLFGNLSSDFLVCHTGMPLGIIGGVKIHLHLFIGFLGLSPH